MFIESTTSADKAGAGVISNMAIGEAMEAHGHYWVECHDADGNLKWADEIENAVCGEGKISMLQNFINASAFTQTLYMGLISSANYSTGPAASNTAANISTTTATNGWCEAVAGTCAARQAPSFGSAVANGNNGRISLSTARTFAIVGTDTIKGVFLLVKSSAAVAPTSTVGNTSGALYSAGLFSGGDKAVANGDTLSVSYQSDLT